MLHFIQPLLYSLALAFTLSIQEAQAQNSSEALKTAHLQAMLISSQDSFSAGESFHVGILFQIIPHWHVYWKNPGDSGESPRYSWKASQGIEIGDIQWPRPSRFPINVLANYGYENNILLPVSVKVPASYSASTLKLQLDAEWLVCQEECVPEKGSFEITLPRKNSNAATGSSSRHMALFENTLGQVPQSLELKDAHFESTANNTVKLVLPLRELLLKVEDFEFEIFPVDSGVFEAGIKAQTQHDENVLRFELTLTPQTLKLPQSLRFVVSAKSQSSDQEDVSVEFNSKLQTAPSSNANSEFTIWLALLGAFLGGLLLNLMPCVLPVLSLKAFSLIKQSDPQAGDKSASKMRADGIAYTLGVMVSFWALAALLLFLRSGGEALGWGFQLQNPIFVLAMTLLFVLLSLNFFGVFEFGHSFQAWIGRKAPRKNTQTDGSVSGSFMSGVLATLIATPCTAPFMGSALGFAFTLPALQALLIFTVLGFGMALPILLLSFYPKALKILPKPGAWMEHFKKFMGFPMLATATWLLWVYSNQTDSDSVIRFIFTSLAMSLAFWIYGSFRSSWKRHLFFVISLTLSVFLAMPLLTQPSNSNTSSHRSSNDYSGLAYESFSQERLDELLSEGRPVYVDYTASWCLICQVNKRVVFPDADVQSLFKAKNIMILKADWTDKNESILRALESFGRSGVPLNVYYSPQSPEKPHILPSVLRPQTVIDAISQASP